ncbi:MAG: hypothetical protein ACLUIQ_05940 [Dialister invisus]
MVLLFLEECPAGRGFLSVRLSRWEVWRRMARKYFSFRSFHRGTVLFEVLLAAVILSLAALAVIPLYTDGGARKGWNWQRRKWLRRYGRWKSLRKMSRPITLLCQKGSLSFVKR